MGVITKIEMIPKRTSSKWEADSTPPLLKSTNKLLKIGWSCMGLLIRNTF